MPVQSIECQLVRAQIGRYLGGEPLSKEAMRQLEVHLVACDDCRGALSSRKAELRAKMSTEGFDAKPKPKVDPESIAYKAVVDYKAIESATNAASAKPAKPEKPTRSTNFTKPLALTAVLAVVLVAMSRFSGGNGLSFGPNALTALVGGATDAGAKAAKSTAPVQAASTPANPPATSPAPSAAAVPTPVSPASTPLTTKPTDAVISANPTKPVGSPTTALATLPIPSPSGATATTANTQPASALPTPTSPSASSPKTETQPAAKPPVAADVKPTTAKPAVTDSKAAEPKVAETKAVAEPEVHTVAEPRPVHRSKLHKTSRKRLAAARVRKAHKAVHHKPIARIRVYDASGAPLKP
jgi:hypothetical protein